MEETEYSLFFIFTLQVVLLETIHRPGVDISGTFDHEALLGMNASQWLSEPGLKVFFQEAVVVFVLEFVELRFKLPSFETVPQYLTVLHAGADHSQLFNALCHPHQIEQHFQDSPLPEQTHLLKNLNVAYALDPWLETKHLKLRKAPFGSPQVKFLVD